MHTEVEAARILAELRARGPHTQLDAVRALTARASGPAPVRIPAQRVPTTGPVRLRLVES